MNDRIPTLLILILALQASAGCGGGGDGDEPAALAPPLITSITMKGQNDPVSSVTAEATVAGAAAVDLADEDSALGAWAFTVTMADDGDGAVDAAILLRAADDDGESLYEAELVVAAP